MRWSDVQNIAVSVICKGLVSLGICKGTPKTVQSKKEYYRFYMHGLGHLVGLDVHDVGWIHTLKKGMVLAVEPGLYIPNSSDIPSKYRNIGVRVEDTILVKEKGCEVLTDAPKTISEIEGFMCSSKN